MTDRSQSLRFIPILKKKTKRVVQPEEGGTDHVTRMRDPEGATTEFHNDNTTPHFPFIIHIFTREKQIKKIKREK